jgi:hypothetical protein
MWPDRRVTDLFGIEHPLILAPMTGVGTVNLAASVCAGGCELRDVAARACCANDPAVAREGRQADQRQFLLPCPSQKRYSTRTGMDAGRNPRAAPMLRRWFVYPCAAFLRGRPGAGPAGSLACQPRRPAGRHLSTRRSGVAFKRAMRRNLPAPRCQQRPSIQMINQTVIDLIAAPASRSQTTNPPS